VAALTTSDVGYWDVGQCGANECWRNYGRNIDTGVWNFITTYSNP